MLVAYELVYPVFCSPSVSPSVPSCRHPWWQWLSSSTTQSPSVLVISSLLRNARQPVKALAGSKARYVLWRRPCLRLMCGERVVVVSVGWTQRNGYPTSGLDQRPLRRPKSSSVLKSPWRGSANGDCRSRRLLDLTCL